MDPQLVCVVLYCIVDFSMSSFFFNKTEPTSNVSTLYAYEFFSCLTNKCYSRCDG